MARNNIVNNLIGKIFGFLTVLNRVENNRYGSAQWKCLCKCGNLTTVTTGNLNSGTRTCGSSECTDQFKKLSYTPKPNIDISNLKFGKLTVIEYVGPFNGKFCQWKLLCDCGNIVYNSSSYLKNIKNPSCGSCVPKRNILEGQIFGRLFITKFAYIENNQSFFEYVCECGTCGIIKGVYLTSGNTQSCGCLHLDSITKHGYSYLKEYKIFSGIYQRCYNEKNINYPLYGGRGIKICDRWLEPNGIGVKNFIKDMGLRPDNTYSIERIDNDLDYEPNNCKWIPFNEQYLNKRSNILNHSLAEYIRDLYFNQHKSQIEISEAFEISQCTVSQVINYRIWV